MDDVAASLSKKPRQGELEQNKATETTDGGGSDDVSLDLISCLPNDILGSIISLLPIKGAVQTSLLSSRWHHLWCSAPLNLVVDYKLSGQECNLIDIVSKLLAAHTGPARRLCLGRLCLGDVDGIRHHRGLYAKFDGWFRSPALDGLEEFEFISWWGTWPPLPLPPSALRFAPTLRVASIGYCDFPEINAAAALLLPRLKQLKLCNVAISEATIQYLLAGCIVIESLQLDSIHGLSIVRIVSPTLRSISVSVSYDNYKKHNELVLQELVIEDAPCLERLIPSARDKLKIISAIAVPKLMVLGCLSRGISKLVLGTVIVKEMVPISLTASVRTVKVLALQSVGPNLESVIGFLRCFPCIEKLYIESFLRSDIENVLDYNTLDPIECLELHLKVIVLNSYQGRKPDVNFAKFFVLNAKVLKVMKFCIFFCHDYKKWIANQHRRLQLKDRASRDARFDFERHRCSCLLYHSKHKHDMWMADPFESSLCKCR